MQVQPPKRTPDGFHLVIDPALTTPIVRWNNTESVWECNSDIQSWISSHRSMILEELLRNGKWFSRPPRREMLETLFSPWVHSDGNSGSLSFTCHTPTLPDHSQGMNLSATWGLTGIMMNAKMISPVWSIVSIQEESSQPTDTITLFEEEAEAEAEHREIQFHEIEMEKGSAPTKLKTREWEARKFVGKERVREARLKAQIAKRIAKKEESRYYEQFGDPDDGESRISEFDLTDSDSEAESEFETAIAE